MLKKLFLAVVLTAFTASASAAEIQTYFGFHVDITNAPAAPKVVYREEPRVVLVSGTDVFMVARDDYDCDVFHVGSYWYATSGGYWYRARSYRGPFKVVDARRVPRAIFATPSKHWRHHPHGGPPGQMKKQMAKVEHSSKKRHEAHSKKKQGGHKH